MNSFWFQANRNLIAKAIGELAYEQVLYPEVLGPASTGGISYSLKLDQGGEYTFTAWQTVWDFLRVNPTSLNRIDGTEGDKLTAAQFFIDLQKQLGMDPICLGNFLEEMHSSLHSDMRILANAAEGRCTEWALWDQEKLQSVLPGHPKILLNKGRIGWGKDELADYAPENQTEFPLYYLAVHHRLATASLSSMIESERILLQCLYAAELQNLKDEITAIGVNAADYWIMPVHPWQYQRYIHIQYADAIAKNEIIPLGLVGDVFKPQISIRTMTNSSRPQNCDVKLSLSILNTSAVRGISSRYISNTVALSAKLEELCQQDSILKSANTAILKELAGIAVEHPHFQQIPNAPYRYHEFLGAIFRESVRSKLQEGEIGVLTAALSLQDQYGDSLIAFYIRSSGLTTEDWLERYFTSVVVPLYHLQLRYGIGIVAHGQNIVLRLKNFIPMGIFLKDFQGDLRLADHMDSPLRNFDLDSLKPEFLIHDLITGHFVSVLRFVSATLFESQGFSEKGFYQILSNVLQSYLQKTDHGAVEPAQDLLRAPYQRVLLNKVRFAIGYGDRTQRPLPMLGTELRNPLNQGGVHEHV